MANKQSTVDQLIGFGAGFDWITPLYTFVLDWQRRPTTGYNIPIDGGWSAYAVRDLLKKKGVKLWGLTIVDSVITFRVRQAQARYAQMLMSKAGVPYQGGI